MTPPFTAEQQAGIRMAQSMQLKHELLQALLTPDRWLNICPLCSSEPCRCDFEVWEEEESHATQTR